MSDEEKSVEIIDLDVIKPKPRKVKIQGKVIDINLIPFDVTLDMAEHFDSFIKLGKMFKKTSLQKLKEGKAEIQGEIDGKPIKDVLSVMYSCTVKILTNADESITEDWIRKNVSSEQMMILISALLEPLMDQWGTQKKMMGL
jgi:hypothetical protein